MYPFVAFDPIYVHPIPENHRFPMVKYQLLSEEVPQRGLGKLFTPKILSQENILKCHTKEYLDKLLEGRLTEREQRVIGFKYSKQLIERERIIAGGTIQCTLNALQDQVSLNIAGGTHHAYTDRGEGFCILNDQAIAAQFLIDHKLTQRVLIIDLDVHQGNGTAEIFQNNSSVFTMSFHGEKNYPFRKEKSDLDVSLATDTNDAYYLNALKNSLKYIFETFKPDFLFFQSGVDVLATDKLGKLQLTIKGCKKRDEIVFDFADRYKLPIVVCMGGGYSEDINIIMEAHLNTFSLAKDLYQKNNL